MRVLWPAVGAAVVIELLDACTGARAPDGSAPVVAVEPVGSTLRTEPPPASATAPPPPASCEEGFVEVIDGAETVRYVLGRESVRGVRGAKHAFVEEVLHKNGEIVLHVEALAKADGYGGHLSLTLTGFHEPTSFPAAFESGYVEYMAPGLTSERDERRLDAPRVEITAWGPPGSWVEGTFSPGAPPATAPPSAAPPGSAPSGAASGRLFSLSPRRTTPYRGRFRVCRTADWRVRL